MDDPNRDQNGRFVKGHAKTGGRRTRADEAEMLDLFDRAVPQASRIKIIRMQVARAERGNLDSAKWLWSYMYGNPVQRSEHTGADGGAVEITDERFNRAISSLIDAIRASIPDPRSG